MSETREKEYSVVLPLAGSILVYVTAENPKAAIEKAQEANFRLRLDAPDGDVDLGGEVTTPARLCDGNVVYAPCPEAEVEEI